MATPTTKHQLVDAQLGRPGALAELVKEARRETPPATWDEIAFRLREKRGIRVSEESLRTWAANGQLPDPARPATTQS